MAGASLLALLDDISSMLDDVALMTKVAATKTVGVVGDDLALNAEQVAGVRAERELPVVWAVAKGSLVNKAILIPSALLVSAVAPRLVLPLLMAGGCYLCFEGAEKVFHRRRRAAAAEAAEPPEPDAAAGPADEADVAVHERAKVKGAIRTDFVLSAEIIVVTLGTIPPEAPLLERAGVLLLIGVLMTVGVYGLVAAIVKLDDFGFWLLRGGGSGLRRRAGSFLVGAAPKLMRLLTVVGTAAMFLVGGGILGHGLPFFHHVDAWLSAWPATWLWSLVAHTLLGAVAGAALLGAIHAWKSAKAQQSNKVTK